MKTKTEIIAVTVFLILVGAILGLLINWGINSYLDNAEKKQTQHDQTKIDLGIQATLTAITISVMQHGYANIQPISPTEYNHTITCIQN